MSYAQSDIAPPSIESLCQKLPPFNAAAVADVTVNSTLKNYLNFFRLPHPSANLQIHAGHLSDADQQTFIMGWQPVDARGTVVVVHGYLDHTGLFRNLIAELLNRQFAVVCFDLIGHGLSSGEPAYIDNYCEYVHQLDAVVNAASKFYPAPLHGIGQSTGGAVLLKQLLEQGNSEHYPFASLNLLAPLGRPKLWALNRWVFKFTGPFRKTIKRVFRKNSHDQAFLDFLRCVDPFQPERLPKAWIGAMAQWVEEIEAHPGSGFPINIIQGDKDGTLDWRHNIKLFEKKFPQMRLSIIQGAGHHLVNEREDLRKKVFAAIKI